MLVNRNQEERYEIEEKTDGVFRVFAKTNSMKVLRVLRIELPDNQVHKKFYSILPSLIVMYPYIGQSFEYYIDNKYIGMRKLLSVSNEVVRFEEVL
jgi:hypothetical protein